MNLFCLNNIQENTIKFLYNAFVSNTYVPDINREYALDIININLSKYDLAIMSELKKSYRWKSFGF